MRGMGRVAAFLGLALATGACGEATGPDQLDLAELEALAFEELAVVATDGAVQDIGFMNNVGTPGLRFPVLRFPDFTGDRPDCPRKEGRYRCGPRKGMEGLEVERTVTFHGQGGVMESYDPELTSWIEFELEASGEITHRNFTAVVNRERHLEVTGLLGDETVRTWAGGGTSDVKRKGILPNGEYRNVRVQKSTEVRGVVVPVPEGEERPWPLEGRIASDATITHTSESGESWSVTKTVVIEFDGDSTAWLTIDGERQEVDLNQHREPRFARHGWHRG